MPNENVADHGAAWREDARARLVAIMFEAKLAEVGFDELLGSARKDFERLVEAEVEGDKWDEQEREY